MNNKVIAFIFSVLLIGTVGYFLSTSIFKRSQTLQTDNTKLSTMASFYPLYYFASEIGGDKSQITNLTPSGVEPHDYDPTPQEIARIQKSNLLVVNGAGFEPWLDKIKDDLNNVVVVDTSQGLNLQEGQIEGKDPHIWLSPVLAKSQVDKILQGYIQVDPTNRAFYSANAQRLKEKLDELDMKFKQGLSSCSQKSFVTSHAAFWYLAREYNLTQVPISGLSPDEEPSPQRLAEIADFARKNGVKYIFFETLVNPRFSETIAQEMGAQTLVLNPIEGLSNEELKQGKDYLSVQEENLSNLRIALNCK
ncbi:zinc ABC transporter substrate-binding protein [Candidatus Gottesmanbacteria bacterium]|nr:zinc ABC transporter substrate-binding protein [Candidatus Gottesmanbacteria bacterium]